MTATEMIPSLGATVRIALHDLQIDVHVLDVRHVWGKPQLLVQPVSGSGQKWIDCARLVALRHEASRVPVTVARAL